MTPADLNNGVINAAFMLLFRDLIRLFACYNDGIINLLGKSHKVPSCLPSKTKTCFLFEILLVFSEKYFDMNKKNARDALDLYKKFLIRMDRVAEFLKVAEASTLLLKSNGILTSLKSLHSFYTPLQCLHRDLELTRAISQTLLE